MRRAYPRTANHASRAAQPGRMELGSFRRARTGNGRKCL